MNERPPTVPAGARVVHIGFDKTGTTALQGPFAGARGEVAAAGVVYPGTERYHKRAGVAVTTAGGNTGDRPVTMADWDELVEQVAAAGDRRVLVSSEWLCRADEEQARTVVAGLGGPRVHVVATIRPLVKILPSAWQQYVKDGFTGDYESWLNGMLREPPYEQPTPWFWIRHSHDVVLARWASIVGPDNVTAIVVDELDRLLLLRQFEALLGLPDGLLIADPPEKENRSLSWPEVEMLRAVNAAFRTHGWSEALYGLTVRRHLLPRLAQARATLDAAPIVTPTWALEAAAAVGAAAAAAIAGSGITVVGDLDSLGRVPSTTSPEVSPVISAPMVPAELAADAVLAVVAGMHKAGKLAPVASGTPRTPQFRGRALPEF